MKKYKLIIFDFDGTLADTVHWFSRAINQAAEKYNFRRLTTEEMEKLRGLETKEILSYLGIRWWKMPLIASYMRKLMEEERDTISLFEGVDELLLRLSKEDVTLAIVSSNSRANVSHILGARNMAYFSFVDCGASIFGKPKKYRKLLAKTKLEPHEVLSVGDETRDIEAARAAKIHSAAVTWGYAREEALLKAKPDHMFCSILNLLN